ncbi:MAG: hypothetical protein WC229_02190 [Candidatus Paceibacterota bacterium]|jgi:flagellar basal body-associated protein FliL
MKKNIIIIVSIIIVLLVVVAAITLMNSPEKKAVVKQQPVYIDAVTDVKNDLDAINFGNLDNEFNNVNKDIQSL